MKNFVVVRKSNETLCFYY